MNTTYPCGCVKDAYWCGPHDIYAIPDPNNPVPWGGRSNQSTGSIRLARAAAIKADKEDRSRLESMIRVNDQCACHINPPCDYCANSCPECRERVEEDEWLGDGNVCPYCKVEL